MSEQQQLTGVYADTLITLGKTIQHNNEMGKEKVILNLVKNLDKSTQNMIKMLEFEKEIMA